MKKHVSLLVCVVVVAGLLLGPSTKSARAVKPFALQFYSKYIKEDSARPEVQEYAQLVKSTKCHLCHEGKSKKHRNAYGRELSKLLDKKTDKKNVKKIQAALAKVETMHVKPDDENSPTFGELIAQCKLPGGDPKKEEKK